MKTTTIVGAAALAVFAFPGVAHAQDRSNELRIVVPYGMEDLEPCDMARSGISRVIQENVVETLVELDPESGALHPSLATEWQQQDDGSVRFTLREGVTFHDGSELDAQAVAHTLERLMQPDLECSTAQKFFSGVALSSAVVDDLTIEIASAPAQPTLPLLMAHVAIVPLSTPGDQRITTPVGTGPFEIDTVQPGQEALLVTHETYWDEAPAADRVRYIYRADSAVAAAMVAAGEADLAPYITRADATNPETDVAYPNSDTLYMPFAMNTPPLTDKRVREAINYAIDREAFVGTVFGEGVVPASQMVLPFITGYNHELEPWPYDPERAAELVEEAAADGVPVDRELAIYTTVPVLVNGSEIGSVISQMLNEVGLNTQVQVVEIGQYRELVYPPHLGPEEREPGMFLWSHDNISGDAGITLNFKYHSEGSVGEFHDEELDLLIEQGLAARGEERDELFAEAFAQIHHDIVPHAILFHLVGYARVSPGIDWEPTSLTGIQVPVEDITFN